MKKRIKNTLLSLIFPVAFVILWQYTAVNLDNESVLPKVTTVFYHLSHPSQNFIGLGSLFRNLGFSLARLLTGYFSAVIIALVLGLLMGYFPLAKNLLENFINLFKPIPPIAWQPLVLGWFGISSIATLSQLDYGQTFVILDNLKLSMIFLIALGSFFPVALNTMFGVVNVPKKWIESARVLGANNWELFLRILLPAAGPNILNGLRTALNTAWVCLISAEMLPGSMAGIGYFITHAYELARIDLVITGMIIIGFSGWLMDSFFRYLSNRFFYWSSK